MVKTLVEATARTIAERGLADTTTNHIATRAGVSVGSLYQYFASKEALLEALMDKLVADLIQVVDQRFYALLDADLRTSGRGLLTAIFDFLQKNEALYLELLRNWHQLRTLRAMDAMEKHMMEVFRLYFLRHHQEFQIENLPAKLFIIINSAMFTGVRYLSLRHTHLKREEVIEGLTEMVTNYLQAGRIRA